LSIQSFYLKKFPEINFSKKFPEKYFREKISWKKLISVLLLGKKFAFRGIQVQASLY
jgi:hypothetical protein